MDFMIASTIATDELHFAEDKTVKTVAGGAGIYALCGIKLWSDSVMLATGIGEDFDALYGSWFQNNHVSMDGMEVRDAHTPYNIVTYFSDGSRKETPRYGQDHYRKMEADPKKIAPYLQTAKGVYLFKNSSPDFWNELLPSLKQRKAKVLWEIADDAACSECLCQVQKIAENVDIFSINMAESRRLFQVETVDEVVENFRKWKIELVFLRQGAQGSILITPENVVTVPSVKDVQVMDVTGGGNSSSGAVLYGYCSGYTPKECGMMGSIAAAMCLKQFGIPACIDENRRKKAMEMLRNWKEKGADEK